MDSEPKPPRTPRNWPELREWANFALAATALLVSIASVWTTTQISGLEDYLRSEVSLRNAELEEAATVAKSLDDRVRQSTTRLEGLRANADRLLTSAIESQTRIAAAQTQSLDLLTDQQRASAALGEARSQLASVSNDIQEQKEILDSYRREEVYSKAIQRFSYLSYASLFGDSELDKKSVNGTYALSELRNFGIEVSDPTVREYYAAIREIGPAVCRNLATFNPTFPKSAETPSLTPLRGEKTDHGTIRTTTQELKDWNARQEAWSAQWDRVIAYNASIRNARNEAQKYIRDSLWHCSCIALKGPKGCDAMPDRPDIGAMIKPKP